MGRVISLAWQTDESPRVLNNEERLNPLGRSRILLNWNLPRTEIINCAVSREDVCSC